MHLLTKIDKTRNSEVIWDANMHFFGEGVYFVKISEIISSNEGCIIITFFSNISSLLGTPFESHCF